MASYPSKFQIESNFTQERILNNLSEQEIQNLGLNNSIVFELQSAIISGGIISQNFSIRLFDIENNQLITDNQSWASLVAYDQNKVSLYRSKEVQADQGVLLFNDVIIVAEPGSQVLLKLEIDSIKHMKLQKAFPQIGSIPDLYIVGQVRLCQRGEYQTQDNKCVVCSDGQYNILENQKECFPCPDNSVCSQGYKIVPISGYWRSDVQSTNIFKCLNPDACISDYEPTCAPGYTGNLCHSCTKNNGQWYSLIENSKCVKCISFNINSLRLAGVIILICVYIIILIWVNLKTAGKYGITTVYMRILTNYFQIILLTQSYELSWEDNLKKFLESVSFIGKTPSMILSQDCFFRELYPDIHPEFIKIVLIAVVPFAGIILNTIFWAMVKILKQNSNYTNNFTVSLIVFFYVIMPPVTLIGYSIFNCVDIFNDGNTYLQSDLSIQCWVGDHDFYAKAIAIPTVVLWTIILPTVLLIVLFRQRKSLLETYNITKFGFMYIGFMNDAFYWEFLIHYRKICIIIINMFMIFMKPVYRFSTFCSGLFYITEGLPVAVQLFLLSTVICANLYFWYSWFKAVFEATYEKIKKCLLKIFPCLVRKNKKGQAYLDESTSKLDESDNTIMGNGYYKNLNNDSSLSHMNTPISRSQSNSLKIDSDLYKQQSIQQNSIITVTKVDRFNANTNRDRTQYDNSFEKQDSQADDHFTNFVKVKLTKKGQSHITRAHQVHMDISDINFNQNLSDGKTAAGSNDPKNSCSQNASRIEDFDFQTELNILQSNISPQQQIQNTNIPTATGEMFDKFSQISKQQATDISLITYRQLSNDVNSSLNQKDFQHLTQDSNYKFRNDQEQKSERQKRHLQTRQGQQKSVISQQHKEMSAFRLNLNNVNNLSQNDSGSQRYSVRKRSKSKTPRTQEEIQSSFDNDSKIKNAKNTIQNLSDPNSKTQRSKAKKQKSKQLEKQSTIVIIDDHCSSSSLEPYRQHIENLSQKRKHEGLTFGIPENTIESKNEQLENNQIKKNSSLFKEAAQLTTKISIKRKRKNKKQFEENSEEQSSDQIQKKSKKKKLSKKDDEAQQQPIVQILQINSFNQIDESDHSFQTPNLILRE